MRVKEKVEERKDKSLDPDQMTWRAKNITKQGLSLDWSIVYNTMHISPKIITEKFKQIYN